MDVLSQFLEDRSSQINFRALIISRNHLASIQSQLGWLTPNDLRESFSTANYMFSEIEFDFHRALMLETCLQPCLGSDGLIRLKLREDMTGNDVLFTSSLLNTINIKTQGENYPAVQELKKSMSMFLSAKVDREKRSSPQNSNTPFSENFGNDRSRNFQNPGVKLLPAASAYPAQQSYNPPKRNIETCEPVVRFLAQIRKQGMDVLFPQDIHDKVLCCIFVAVQIAKNPAHRELIDMVMTVKESNMFPNMNSVSKTKIRGILALLKHGDVLMTSGVEGMPVNLYLSSGVESFQSLRERHDSYLFRFVHENHIPMPTDIWHEIVWRSDPEFKSDYLTKMSVLIQNIQRFFTTQIRNHQMNLIGGVGLLQESSFARDLNAISQPPGLTPPSLRAPPMQEQSITPEFRQAYIVQEDNYGRLPRKDLSNLPSYQPRAIGQQPQKNFNMTIKPRSMSLQESYDSRIESSYGQRQKVYQDSRDNFYHEQDRHKTEMTRVRSTGMLRPDSRSNLSQLDNSSQFNDRNTMNWHSRPYTQDNNGFDDKCFKDNRLTPVKDSYNGKYYESSGMNDQWLARDRFSIQGDNLFSSPTEFSRESNGILPSNRLSDPVPRRSLMPGFNSEEKQKSSIESLSYLLNHSSLSSSPTEERSSITRLPSDNFKEKNHFRVITNLSCDVDVPRKDEDSPLPMSNAFSEESSQDSKLSSFNMESLGFDGIMRDEDQGDVFDNRYFAGSKSPSQRVKKMVDDVLHSPNVLSNVERSFAFDNMVSQSLSWEIMGRTRT